MLVTEALEEMDGVAAVHASHEEGIVKVEYDEAKVGLDALRSVIEGQGFSVSA
jgi:copper chaperone CopZ